MVWSMVIVHMLKLRSALEHPIQSGASTRTIAHGRSNQRADRAGTISAESPVRAVHAGQGGGERARTGCGNLVIIDHGAETFSLYGQLGAPQVERGAKVERGEVIGTTGRILAGIPGVYFEIRVDGKPVDPLEWLKKR